MLSQIAGIAIGSALGGVSRFGLSKLLNPILLNFPLGTFSVNIIGCFIFGFLNAFAAKSNTISPTLQLALSAGFCGSFTTFSTFIYETSSIANHGKVQALIYASCSLIFGILAIFFTDWLVKKFF